MATKVENPPITITQDMFQFRPCPHCQTDTWQIGDLPEGWDVDDMSKGKKSMGRCLQCIADGGTCCTLEDFNRWPQDE